MKNNIKRNLEERFTSLLGEKPEKFFFAPGRVNFIGEHIDYNGGFVMPFAISKGIYAALSLRKDSKIVLFSEIDSKIYEFDISEDFNQYRNSSLWVRYPLGIIQAYRSQGYSIQGFSVYYQSDLPVGAGLSSSAALEVLTAYYIQTLFGTEKIDAIQMALLCQKVENQFIGVQCGIMDPFIISMGKKNHFMILNTHSFDYRFLLFPFQDISIVVINTNRPRSLSESVYNERKKECEESFHILKDLYGIQKLVDADESMLKNIKSEKLYNRAYHVITENRRVLEIETILKSFSNDTDNNAKKSLKRIGKLLYESHDSLRNFYEVSCEELDLIIDESKKIKGVYGARMTGAGFGGCAIALVEHTYLEEYKETIGKVYRKKTGLKADIFPVQIENGVEVIYGN